MNISITTDYAGATGAPEPALRRIAGAGFTHIHWCHHFNDDFVYGGYEVDGIKSVIATTTAAPPTIISLRSWVQRSQLLPVIAGSPCRGPLSFEIVMRQTPFVDPAAMEQPEERQVAFLADAFRRCAGMTEQYGKDFSRHET